MTPLSCCAQKMFLRVPKTILARNINQIPTRTIKIPSRYDLLKQAATDRLLLNWFNNAWSKTKSTIMDNWESAGVIKKRKPDDESAAKTVGKTWKTDKSLSQNVKNISSPVDELTKAKNKAQRHLAEDWDAVNRVNSRTNENLVKNIKERTTSTIDDLSKSVKERADTLIDKTTNDIKSKIREKGDGLKEKIAK